MAALTCADFKPGDWQIKGSTGEYVLDQTTGKIFNNYTSEEIWERACLLAMVGGLPNTCLSAACIGVRTLRLGTCFHCWKETICDAMRKEKVTLTCKDRLKDAGIDFLKCIGAPFLCLGMQYRICATCVCPTRNNNKYIHSCNELQYDGFSFACAHDPLGHSPQSQLMTDHGAAG